MHLEKGPEIYQKLVLRTCTFAPSEEVLMNEWNKIYWYMCLHLLTKCTFLLLVDVESREDKSLLLKLMSRTYYQWYFYLLILFTYVWSDKLFSVIDIWKSKCSVVIIALMYSDNYYFYVEYINNSYAICFS